MCVHGIGDEAVTLATRGCLADCHCNHISANGTTCKSILHSQMAGLCLVQVAVDSAGVMGCIDIRLPRSASFKHPQGVHKEDAAGAYILNVVVNTEERGRGVGTRLMRAAMSRAVGM